MRFFSLMSIITGFGKKLRRVILSHCVIPGVIQLIQCQELVPEVNDLVC